MKFYYINSQNISAAREAPEFWGSNYDENKIYQIENRSLEETKEKLDWRNCAFECKLKNTYAIEIRNDMTRIHHKEVNKIAE